MNEEIIGRRVIAARTSRMECLACKRRFNVLRGSEADCGECDCGNTSFHTAPGRPLGHRSQAWNEQVRALWSLDSHDRITPATLQMLFHDADISEWLVLAPVPKRPAKINMDTAG